MNDLSPPPSNPETPHPSPGLSEDWLAVALAFLLIALATLGVIGKAGIPIRF